MLQLIIVIVVGAILFAGSVLVFVYNRFVRLRQNVQEAWGAIDTELQRRHDLIPALVEVVKGYAAHERGTLERVIAARNTAAAGRGADEVHQRQESEMVEALRRLLVVVEAYPQLKADKQFLDLQKQLAETENRLSKSRRFYNANVRELNTAVQSFPWSLLAAPFGFAVEPYFDVEEAARQTPAVRMS